VAGTGWRLLPYPGHPSPMLSLGNDEYQRQFKQGPWYARQTQELGVFEDHAPLVIVAGTQHVPATLRRWLSLEGNFNASAQQTLVRSAKLPGPEALMGKQAAQPCGPVNGLPVLLFQRSGSMMD
jgi:hypothetical protein